MQAGLIIGRRAGCFVGPLARALCLRVGTHHECFIVCDGVQHARHLLGTGGPYASSASAISSATRRAAPSSAPLRHGRGWRRDAGKGAVERGSPPLLHGLRSHVITRWARA